jgi:hypothetical protein
MTRYSFLASLYFGYIPPPFSFVVVHGKRMIWEFSLHFYLSAFFLSAKLVLGILRRVLVFFLARLEV